MQLTNVVARKILNSRKEPTIEVVVEAQGKRAVASAPSGASKGKYEVKDISTRGLDFSISFVNVFGKKLVNEKVSFENFEDLEKIEILARRYDATKNLEFVGGNALYALETAILKLVALCQGKELWQFLLQDKKPFMPRPVGNAVGGGAHIKQQKKTDYQEFLFLPKATKFFDSVFTMQQAYKETRKTLEEKDVLWQGKLTDENAFATTFDNETVLEIIDSVRNSIKEKIGIELGIGLDCAASTLWTGVKYRYNNFSKTIKEKILSKEEQSNYVVELARKYNLEYIEDPMQGEDFKGFANVLRRLKNCFVVGDDLICTRAERLEKALKEKAVNAIIIKPNQVGSLLETKKTIDLAKKNDIVTIISHRSGETLDNALAHFAVGWRIPFIKCGIVGAERMAKLNELLRIERQIIS
ncbi:MAG: enolase C-terminal domain-like protein [Candidatus Pacearchaeota archaeon]